jgi:hypothetical protein
LIRSQDNPPNLLQLLCDGARHQQAVRFANTFHQALRPAFHDTDDDFPDNIRIQILLALARIRNSDSKVPLEVPARNTHDDDMYVAKLRRH